MYDVSYKNKARELRKDGQSLQQIADSLKVSRNTVAKWTQDIILTDEQVSILASRDASHLITLAKNGLPRQFSKKRLEMGEDAWVAYQTERRRKNWRAGSDGWQKRNAEKYVNYREDRKRKLIQYKGGKCEICGYDKDCPPAYDFHHLDPSEKDFSVSNSNLSFEKLRMEVDKCILVCRRCHAEIHYEWNKIKKQDTIDRLKNAARS